MKSFHRVKKNIIQYCMKELRDEELTSEKKSIIRIQEFERYRKHKMKDLHEYESKLGILDEYQDDLLSQVDKCEDDLMNYEMSLQEALQLAND